MSSLDTVQKPNVKSNSTYPKHMSKAEFLLSENNIKEKNVYNILDIVVL